MRLCEFGAAAENFNHARSLGQPVGSVLRETAVACSFTDANSAGTSHSLNIFLLIDFCCSVPKFLWAWTTV